MGIGIFQSSGTSNWDEIQFAGWVSKEHYTLCRFGSSKNKPFCDGTHRTVHFKDGEN